MAHGSLMTRGFLCAAATHWVGCERASARMCERDTTAEHSSSVDAPEVGGETWK